MATIHDEIDSWLAADLHGELSDSEQSVLHAHLLDCAGCRKTHQEIKTMNKVLEETLAHQKPDPAFEQRMLAGFRRRAPQRAGLVKLLVDLMRLRAVQITAVAAALLGLVQIGRMITGENATSRHERYADAEVAAPELANRKLIRNATVELEIVSFDSAVQKITAFANEEHGYVATTDSEKQANGKLRGQVVVKVLPENLDRFLQKIRSLGELKNQTLGTEDV